MSFRPYGEYKESGVEWVPTLPAHWRHTQLRRVARIFAGGTPDRTNLDYWTDGTVPWLNSGSVNDGSITQPSEWITEEAASGGRTRWVPARSVLVALAGQGKTKGMAARLEFASTCNQSMAAIVPTANVDYRFIQFWLYANYQNIRNLAGGDLRDGLNLQHISGIKLPMPPAVEQQAIAEYLDGVTARIDAFTADQEELIALLNERRAATITLAITKGVARNVPMKESGVKWIGEIPEHWSVMKGTWIGRVFGSEAIAEQDVREDEGTPFLKVSSLSPQGFEVMPHRWFVEAPRTRPLADFVVFPKRGAAIFGNKVNIVREPALLDPNLMGWKMFPSFLTEFYAEALKLMRLEEIADVSSVPQINTKHVAALRLPVPPYNEQEQIINYINAETVEIDAAIADAREAIELLKERRAAVISAAVTGKIDVRDRVMTEKTIIEGEPVGVA